MNEVRSYLTISDGLISSGLWSQQTLTEGISEEPLWDLMYLVSSNYNEI